jgi:hypothetical protein
MGLGPSERPLSLPYRSASREHMQNPTSLAAPAHVALRASRAAMARLRPRAFAA